MQTSKTQCSRCEVIYINTWFWSRRDFERNVFNILDRSISFVFCINFKSLYDCLIKLDTTHKKRLMIDIISLRQLYKRREIIEIKWIHDVNNLIDFIIKTKIFMILKKLINDIIINLNTSKWIKRSSNTLHD